MNVSSVNSNISAYTKATPQSSQAQQAQQAQQPQQAQQAEKREPSPAERVELKEEAPKPVTNAFGQTTGSTISVTA
jgi:hypothetical protein